MLTKGDIDWLKDSFLSDLTESVKNALSGKIDAMNMKLDTFVGEIIARREEDTLQS